MPTLEEGVLPELKLACMPLPISRFQIADQREGFRILPCR